MADQNRNTAASASAETETSEKPQAEVAPVEPTRRFVVLHGAVGGVKRDREGKLVDWDYYAGAIVTPEQLANAEAHYLMMGAIEEIGAPEAEGSAE